MKVSKLLYIPLLCAGALGGCDQTMTDGGSIGKDVDQWRAEDRLASQPLKPTIQSWWSEEKAKWPKFQKNCEDAGSCYDKSVAPDAKTE